MYKEGDEGSKRRVDDLQPLLAEQALTGNVNPTFFEGTNFPENYMEFKRISTGAVSECCTDARSMTVYLAEEANVDLIMRDPLKRPDFDWSETFCTLANNTIKIYRRDFDLSEPTLVYYRQPVRIEIQGCIDPYTTMTSVEEIECEFKDDVVELMIDEAVAIIAGDIDSVNQYVRGSQSAEKNN